MRILNLIVVLFLFGVTLSACTEENTFEKVDAPNSDVAGTYIMTMDLSGPFGPFLGGGSVLIYNTANSVDSVWIEDPDFWDSRVKVARNGNTFSVTNGEDLRFGEVVNLTGEFFPSLDSVHIVWTYLQGGAPEDDHVVEGDGTLDRGL